MLYFIYIELNSQTFVFTTVFTVVKETDINWFPIKCQIIGKTFIIGVLLVKSCLISIVLFYGILYCFKTHFGRILLVLLQFV